MDGGPPRKKKSRFFEAGKSKIESLLPRNRKKSDQNSQQLTLSSDVRDTSSIAPDPSAPEPSFDNKASSATYATSSQAENTSFCPVLRDRPAQAVSSASVRGKVTEDPRSNRVSVAESALSNLSVRDTRRDGVYGPEVLSQHAADTIPASGPASSNLGGRLVFGNNTHANTPFHTPIPNASIRAPAPEPAGQSQTPPYPQQSLESRAKGQQRLPHPTYAPLANGYQTHPVFGQYALPPQRPLPRADNMPQLQELKKHTNPGQIKGPLSEGTTDHILPPPELPKETPTTTDPIKRQLFLPRPKPTVDLDRDANGNPLPKTPNRPILNLHGYGITSLPRHATLNPTCRESTAPPHLYTSPNRIEHALAAASYGRKRKRPLPILPPPAYVYKRTNSNTFNIFSGILLYPELCFALASHLTIPCLVSLYAISCDFHTIIDTRFTTVVLSQSLAKAPESSKVFQFRCYAHLSRLDPAARTHPNPVKAAQGMIRYVPSFRWLRMVLHREKVVHEIMTIFAEDGVPLPARCSLALKRMWYMLDIPDNARRIGFIHNKNLMSDLDLYFAMCFFVKLDMRCNDPVAGECRHGMRKMLLSQRSLTTVLKVLKRQMWAKQLDVLKAWVKYRYEPRDAERELSIFGVPATEVGKGKLEYWGLRTREQIGRNLQSLLRPDQLVMREAVRRGLRFHKHFLRSLLYGYVRMDTLLDYQQRDVGRRIEGLEAEYGVDDDIGGEEVPEVGADELLDLGERKEKSVFCVRKEEGLTKEQKKRLTQEAKWLAICREWSKREREDLMEVD